LSVSIALHKDRPLQKLLFNNAILRKVMDSRYWSSKDLKVTVLDAGKISTILFEGVYSCTIDTGNF